MSNLIYISLGPMCRTAQILQAANLRSCSYPLDWAQSGDSSIQELFSLPAEAFYYRNIYTPSIHLRQASIPNVHNNFNASLVQEKPVIGYPYFYNPHRPLGLLSKSYFMRSLTRFWKVCGTEGNKIVFVLSDYVNDLGSELIPNHQDAINRLNEIIHPNIKATYTVVFCKIHQTLSDDCLTNWACQALTESNLTVFDLYSSCSFAKGEWPDDYLSLLVGKGLISLEESNWYNARRLWKYPINSGDDRICLHDFRSQGYYDLLRKLCIEYGLVDQNELDNVKIEELENLASGNKAIWSKALRGFR